MSLPGAATVLEQLEPGKLQLEVVIRPDAIEVGNRTVARVADALASADDAIAPLQAELERLAQRPALCTGNAEAARATTLVECVAGGDGGGGSGAPAQATANAGGTLTKCGSGGASRSIEEIKLVFEGNKGAIYALYNRALRDDPSLQGKVVLALKIAPSSQV